MAAKKNTTASRAGVWETVEAAKALISPECPDTNVSPNQATPRTHTQATIPDLKTEQEAMLPTSILQKMVIKVPTRSIKLMMAASRPTTTGLMRPTAGEIAEA